MDKIRGDRLDYLQDAAQVRDPIREMLSSQVDHGSRWDRRSGVVLDSGEPATEILAKSDDPKASSKSMQADENDDDGTWLGYDCAQEEIRDFDDGVLSPRKHADHLENYR